MRDLLKLSGKSDKTFINYKCHINRFFNYYEDDIFEFIKINYLNLNRTSNTTNVAICSIKFLYSVCFKIELNKKFIPNIKRIQTISSIISKSAFIKIVNNENNLKVKCWLFLAFCSGLKDEKFIRRFLLHVLPKHLN